MSHTTCGHLYHVLRRTEADKLIARCIEALTPVQHRFDTFAFMGNSGALLAPILAHHLHKEMIMVRKPEKEIKRVSYFDVEGYCKAQQYLILDDLICSGRTISRIVEGASKIAPYAEPAGLMLYDDLGPPIYWPGSGRFDYSVPKPAKENLTKPVDSGMVAFSPYPPMGMDYGKMVTAK